MFELNFRIENSKRLPLRDAVEKRPAPEQYRIQPPFQNQLLYHPYQIKLQSSPLIYTQGNHFRNIISSFSPYRITNGYQQLLARPFAYQRGRSLNYGDFFDWFSN